jgi:DNA-binding MurR/RpiR family transcriptional regulator
VVGLDGLTERVQRVAELLSPAEARLAAHLIEHPEMWGFQPTTELADLLGVHRSTIVRFAQRLGYRGYPELQEMVRTAYLGAVAVPPGLGRPPHGDELDQVIRSVLDRELANLRQTYVKLDSRILYSTAEQIAGAREVLVFGRRFSHAIALSASLTLRTLRRGVRLAPEAGGSSLDAVFDLGPEDAALVISLRRHSTPIRRVLELLASKGVPCTLLTDASPVPRVPDHVQLLQAHIGSTSTLDSFTSLVSVSHALCTVVGRLLPEAEERWRAVEEARTHLQVE